MLASPHCTVTAQVKKSSCAVSCVHFMPTYSMGDTVLGPLTNSSGTHEGGRWRLPAQELKEYLTQKKSRSK